MGPHLIGKHVVVWMPTSHVRQILGLTSEDRSGELACVAGEIVAETVNVGLWLKLSAITRENGDPILVDAVAAQQTRLVRWPLIANAVLLEQRPTPAEMVGSRDGILESLYPSRVRPRPNHSATPGRAPR
jgi:hypothetical protein